MIKPTIHLNGTSRDALYEQMVEVGSALVKALDALREAAPNARDYYPQGPDAFEQARREHESRVERVNAVQAEVEDLLNHIAEVE